MDSLAAQTCKDFTVYVGDDCSPSDFGSLIEEYKNRLDIRYTKFDTNLGGKDLVAQWTRCIELTEGEPWLWLFSDDDVMGEKCVECFYNTLRKNSNYDLHHFNVSIINEDGAVVKRASQYPEVLSCSDFFKRRMVGPLDSYVVEYVFRRDTYNKTGGFQNFDMAWGADTATWVKFSRDKGIYTISGAEVFWRSSNVNISPNKSNIVSYRKLMSTIDRILWYKSFWEGLFGDLFYQKIMIKAYAFYESSLTSNQKDDFFDKAINNNLIKSFYIPIYKIAGVARRIIKSILK